MCYGEKGGPKKVAGGIGGIKTSSRSEVEFVTNTGMEGKSMPSQGTYIVELGAAE